MDKHWFLHPKGNPLELRYSRMLSKPAQGGDAPTHGPDGWWRTAVVFLFGLLHGMGFAGVLQELGLPRAQFVPALIAFNVGVEGGQLTVIIAAYVAVGIAFSTKPYYRSRVVIPASIAIALVGAYWAVERLAA